MRAPNGHLCASKGGLFSDKYKQMPERIAIWLLNLSPWDWHEERTE